MLSLYVAAAIHDFDHPGVNNNFLIATGDKRAMFYNDKSVLENHHCAAAFQVLVSPANNFLGTLDRKTYKAVRASIVDMVLATDLAQHFDLLTRFKKKVRSVNKVITSGTFDPFGNADDQSILMQMLMKCADVSNPTKELSLYEKWIDRIMTEFYNQGDMEKQLGLPVSPFMNREAGSSAQKGFIEFIVYPLFEALEQWTPLYELKVNLEKSRERFCDIEKKETPQMLWIPPNRDMDTSKNLGDPGSPIAAAAHARRASIVSPRRGSIAAGIRSMGNMFGSKSSSNSALEKIQPSNGENE